MFGLSPFGLREGLQSSYDWFVANQDKFNRPIYARTSAYGHFGRAPETDGGLSWERTDLVEALKAAMQ